MTALEEFITGLFAGMPGGPVGKDQTLTVIRTVAQWQRIVDDYREQEAVLSGGCGSNQTCGECAWCLLRRAVLADGAP